MEFKPYSRPGNPTVGDFDAAVIADLGAYTMSPCCRWVISLLNATWIPRFDTGHHNIFMRKDGRFAMDDRTLWPQLFCQRFEYICAILQKPANPNDPINPRNILWWTLTNDNILPLRDDEVSHQTNTVLYCLSNDRVAALKYHKDRLVEAVNKDVAENSVASLVALMGQSLGSNHRDTFHKTRDN
ncbi:hypothetical protein DXG01_007503 [Tephrocybe rancida]|nr:hypothetical protein DXG01_007503 [Tephrocybe rancida]